MIHSSFKPDCLIESFTPFQFDLALRGLTLVITLLTDNQKKHLSLPARSVCFIKADRWLWSDCPQNDLWPWMSHPQNLSATYHACNSPHIRDLSNNIPVFFHLYASCLHLSCLIFLSSLRIILCRLTFEISIQTPVNFILSWLSVEGVTNPSCGTVSKSLIPILLPQRGLQSIEELKDWHRLTQMQEFFQGNY